MKPSFGLVAQVVGSRFLSCEADHLVVKNAIQLFEDCVQLAAVNASKTVSGIRPLEEMVWPFFAAHSLMATD